MAFGSPYSFVVFVIAAGGWQFSTTVTSAQAGSPRVVWEHTFRSPTSEYEFKDVAASRDRAWLLVGVRPKGQLGGPQERQLWRLDRDGRVVATIRPDALRSPLVSAKADSGWDRITLLPDGNLFMIVRWNNDLGILLINESGKLILDQPLMPSAPDSVVTRVDVATGDVLITGRRAASGWLARVGTSGRILSQVVVPQAAILHGAAPVADGYVTVGERLRGPSAEIVVSTIDAKGAVTRSFTLPGGHPAVDREPDGGFVVGRRINADKGRKTVVEKYSKAVALEWSVTLPDLARGLRPFNLATCGGQGFLVVGEGAQAIPTAYWVTPNGEVTWQRQFGVPDWRVTQFWNSGLTRWNDDCLIAVTMTTVESVNDRLEQRQIVTLGRIRLK